ncbi:MAG: glycosyltransferase family 4 protein [Chthoniobacteraceae bacterium]|jgi:glycosyltransferase involved in cell wall biosynthesis
MEQTRLLFLHLSSDGGADARLLERLRGLDRSRYAPTVLASSGGPLLDECRELGAETQLRPLCACFVNAGEGTHWSRFLLRPGVMLALARFCKFVRSFVRERHIDAICADSAKSRWIARVAGIRVMNPVAPGAEPAVRAALFTDADVFAGTERHMLDLARGLCSLNVTVSIACPKKAPLADLAREEKFEVIPIEKRGFLDWRAIAILRRELRAGKLNVIHAHNGRTALSAALAVRLAGRGSYVLTQHFLTPCRAGRRGLKAALSSAMHRWISRGAGHVIAISEASRRGIEERGESKKNVTTVPNGISEADPGKLSSPAAVRAGPGIDPNCPLIVCAARLEEEKDVRTLIAAMPAVLASSPQAVCVIAGEGSEREALAGQIRALGLGESVRLAGFCKDALSLINAADVFVLPSIAEPFGLVLVEAMSLGRPVIATRAGGPREIVEDGVTGLLVPPSDPVSLAGAISRLIRDEPLRTGMGARGRERFLQNYTLERMAASVLETYRKALTQGHSADKPASIRRRTYPRARTKPRVLLISHTCQTRAEGQPKAEEIARLGDIELMVLTPRRFNHYGRWQDVEMREDAPFHFEARNVMWGWLGPAQNYLHWYPSLAGILRDFKPDIIDLWQEPWALVSAHACWLRNRILPEARIIIESEQNICKNWPPPFSWFESYTLRNASFAVGRSSGAVEVLRAKGFNGPARVVGNAVDANLFRPMDRTECKRALGLSGFTVGYVGRLVERKGLMDMVEALRYCPSDVTMVFAGAGDYRAALEQRARAAGVEKRIRYLPARPLHELPPVMNALDALSLPSWTVPTWKEQFGRVIIEAHACETPVIGSDSGAIPRVVGEGGLIFPERNPQMLGAAITELRENPERRREMGAVGRSQVEANYTWQQVAARMRDIYFQCLEDPREPVTAPAPSLVAYP